MAVASSRANVWIVGALATLTCCVLLPGHVTGQGVIDLRRIDLPRWTLEEELRLGSVDGEYDAFVRPWLTVDARGRLFVADAGIPAVRVFESDGTYLRQLGRKGQGPGEYDVPVSVGFIGDTVWIMDGGRQRVAFFDQNGRVLDDYALRSEGAVALQQPVDVLGGDDFLVVSPPGPGTFAGFDVGKVVFQQSIIRRNRAGTRADTIVTYPVEAGFMVTKADADGFSVIPYTPIPQLPAVSYDAERNEVSRIERTAAANGQVGAFRVTISRPDGSTIADRRFRYQPRAVAPSVTDSIRAAMRSRFESEGDAPDAAQRLKVALDHLELPAFLPPVSRAVRTGTDGTRWIAREAMPGVVALQYLVTNTQLEPIATVQLPATTVRLTGPVNGDRIWVVEQDDLEVQYLVRYRIVRDDR